MSTGMTRDLSAKLQRKLAEVLDRELHLFAVVVNPEEIGLILIEAATMLCRTSAATIAGYGDDPEKIEHLYRSSITAIVQQLTTSQEDGVARTIAAHQGHRPKRESKMR